MNNEPVAWMDKRTNKCVVFINTPPSDDWIPLYTHPVDAVNTSEQYVDKNQNNRHDLTDEEINELAENTLPNQAIGFVPSWQWIEFARAILRKAQEK